jgi:hypothetical protein
VDLWSAMQTQQNRENVSMKHLTRITRKI